MATAARWLKSGLLVVLASVAVAATLLLALSFLNGYARHVVTKRYRLIADDEMRLVAEAYGNVAPELLELADLPAEQRAGRIAAVQHSTTMFAMGMGGLAFGRDTFPAIAYGPQYAADGAPINVAVREVHTSGCLYPRVGVPRSDRLGWSWCGIGWEARPPYASPRGPEGSWMLVVPLPLVILVSGAWPVLSLRAWLKARAMRKLPGFEPVLGTPEGGSTAPRY